MVFLASEEAGDAILAGGADVSWLVGFVVAGAGYLVSSRLTRGPAVPAAAGVRDTVT